MEVPEQKGWDVQTYDNMVDNVTNGKSTILSNDVRGYRTVKVSQDNPIRKSGVL